MNVIVTIPHSKCISRSLQRSCDLRAEYVATKIYNKLNKIVSKDVKVSLHFANVTREQGDLNRPITRHWAWRTEIQREIEEALENERNVLVLDIHSFPNSIQSFGEDKETNQIPRIVLLDYKNRYSNLKLPFTTIISGSYLNDIMVQTINAGGEALLFEFNEEKSYLTARMLNTFIDKLMQIVLK